MHSEAALAAPAPPVAGIDPPSIPEVTGPTTRRTTSSPPLRLLRAVMGVLRGDKYLVGAYPPEWRAASTRPDDVRRGEGGATTAGDAASATPSKGR